MIMYMGYDVGSEVQALCPPVAQAQSQGSAEAVPQVSQPVLGQEEDEEWRPVVGYEGSYEISSLGRIRSIRYGRIKLLVPAVQLRGKYLRVCLSTYCGGIHRQQSFALHRLVLIAFKGPCPQHLHEGAHLDGVPGNCRASNLEWVTKKVNAAHRAMHGHTYSGPTSPACYITEETARLIISMKRRGDTAKEISIKLGVLVSAVKSCGVKPMWRWLRTPEEIATSSKRGREVLAGMEKAKHMRGITVSPELNVRLNEIVLGLTAIERQDCESMGRLLSPDDYWRWSEGKRWCHIERGLVGIFSIEKNTGELYNCKMHHRPDLKKKSKADIGNIFSTTAEFLHSKQLNYLPTHKGRAAS
jgi:hypothetical protein